MSRPRDRFVYPDSPASPAIQHREIRLALVALLCVTAFGTLGFAIVEGWGFWRSLFFTLITITTVGYGDEGISAAGQILAVGLLLLGIGIASYTFTLVVQTAVASQFAWRRRMQQRIDKLEGHTIVCGFGRMGRTICEELRRSEIPLVVVESEPAAAKRAQQDGYLLIEGCAAEDETLLRAGIQRAAHVVAAVDSESECIVITLSARELRPDIEIISRAEREEDVRKLRRAGASRIVSPFQSGGLEVANAIAHPSLADFLARSSGAHGDVALAEITIEEGSSLAGTELSEYGAHEGARISFVALERPGSGMRIPPRGSEELRPCDLLIVAGHPEDIVRMRERGQAP